MARQRFIVCYDISNPKRLRRVEKTVKAFGVRIQYSVFECLLDSIRLQQLRKNLSETASSNFRIETLGLPYYERSRVTIL